MRMVSNFEFWEAVDVALFSFFFFHFFSVLETLKQKKKWKKRTKTKQHRPPLKTQKFETIRIDSNAQYNWVSRYIERRRRRRTWSHLIIGKDTWSYRTLGKDNSSNWTLEKDYWFYWTLGKDSCSQWTLGKDSIPLMSQVLDTQNWNLNRSASWWWSDK